MTRMPFRLSCQQATRLLSRRMDHGLGPFGWLRLQVHLRACRDCPVVARQLHLISRATKKLGDGKMWSVGEVRR